VAEVYPDGSTESLAPVGVVARPLEGECRPTHFVGVVEVVSRLFRTVGPCHTFFGEKDFQQLKVVRRLVGDLGLPVRPGPAHRQRRGGGRMTSHDDPFERRFALPQGQASSP